MKNSSPEDLPRISLLDSLFSLSDLKKIPIDQLDLLAEECRKKIIEVLSKNGGHLSSNLGIVDLTIALHYVFSSPKDKLIFDTSHQTYTHKLLTGRKDRFSTLRKHKGINGFSDPSESPHDFFYSGHAGTSLSLALGLAKLRDLRNINLLEQETFSQEDFLKKANDTQNSSNKNNEIDQNPKDHLIPILGDASFNCGLTLEALNHIPKNLPSFIVILNDNKLAISQNTGHIKNILSRFLNNPTSNKVYQDIQNLLYKIPNYGPSLAKQGQRLTESLKNLVSPAPFFEQFGLSYVGPIDGHDIQKLIETFSAVKNAQSPVIIHVLTTKGKGWKAVSENPIPYHGVKPFDIIEEKISPSPQEVTFPKIFGKTLVEIAKKDPSLVVLTPAMLEGSSLTSFMQEFPDRCFDVGIAEGHGVTFCGALAYKNQLKVVCSVYSTFLLRALDNVFHDVCLQEINVVFAIDRAGINGPDGSTHHGIYDISFLYTMPNMVIAQPRNGQLLKELLHSSFSWKRPVAIRYPNASTTEPLPTLRPRFMGKAEILVKGKELLIIPLGTMVLVASQVKDLLKEHDLYPTIVDPIFLKPLDSDLFYELLSSHKYIVTIEEHSLNFGLGTIMNNFILQNHLENLQVINFGIPDTFVKHGDNASLFKDLGLDAESITKKILRQFDFVKTSHPIEENYDHRPLSQ
jgi:1-deoxy-D-xylulose-5-phosphate synthase